MTGLHRPGPEAIEEHQAPGGLVFHVYAIDDDRLVATDRMCVSDRWGWQPSPETIASAIEAGAVCLVVYDGDTGLRWTPEDFEAAGFRAGQELL